MDTILFNGTPKYQIFLLSPKITYLDYIKLLGVHGNLSDTVAGSFASRPKIDTCVPHIFSWIFLSSTNSRKTSCQLLANAKWSLNSKEKN